MKNLIIYFSIFGSTKQFAEMIHDKVGGDLVEIKPVVPYETGYKELMSFSKQEVDNHVLTEFVDLNINIDDYENVFVGYPMWWYSYPPIIKNFFKKYDMKGKTIIPFNTHEGSGDGGTYSEIAHDLPDSKVLKGLAIRGGDVSDKKKKAIDSWLTEIGF